MALICVHILYYCLVAGELLTFYQRVFPNCSTGAIPLVSKLSPGQASYHFLAGYQDGKFLPAYSRGPSPLDPLALAMALFSHVHIKNYL